MQSWALLLTMHSNLLTYCKILISIWVLYLILSVLKEQAFLLNHKLMWLMRNQMEEVQIIYFATSERKKRFIQWFW